LGIVDAALIVIFLIFYAGIFYNISVLAAGVHDLRKHKLINSKIKTDGEEVLPFFSIIVPVKNERTVVRRLLNSLHHLSYPKEKVEIIIVDDGSIDGTVEVCRAFAVSHDNVNFLLRKVSEGKASALNYGLAHSFGDIIAIFDADNVPASDALYKAAGYFSDPKVAAVQGRLHSINSHENMLTQFLAYEDAVWCEAFLRGKDSLGLFVHLRGCCQFVRSSTLKDLGGFDEETLAEDIEVSARLTEQHHSIKYASDVKTWQESPSTLIGFLKQRIRWYRGHMEVALKYGRLLKHLDRRNLDVELTLFLPFLAIASLFLFALASCGVFAAFFFDSILSTFMLFSSLTTYILVFLAGFALIYVSKPKRVKNVLWLPFVFGYWCLQSFVALYAFLLILFRRPRRWVKTEKSGAVYSPEFALEVLNEKSDQLVSTKHAEN
jgi:cellulose synthase/poly-beta-1,6-N-acetylglucosamine synthase-like glycosyltransferase